MTVGFSAIVIVITVVADGKDVLVTLDVDSVVCGVVTMLFHVDIGKDCTRDGGGGGGGGGGDVSTGFSITISILWRRGSRE